jgi:hypothetical protein
MRGFSRSGFAVSAAALGAAWLVAGCTPDPEERAPQCPTAMLRPDASSLTRYDGRGTDLANLVLSGRLTNIKGACKGLLGHHELTAHAHAEMELTRGPAATGRDVDVPYIVAVVKDGQVLEERDKVQHVTFPPNVDTVQVTGEDINFSFPTRRGLGGEKYTIYILFRLSPEELAANRRALHPQ